MFPAPRQTGKSRYFLYRGLAVSARACSWILSGSCSPGLRNCSRGCQRTAGGIVLGWPVFDHDSGFDEVGELLDISANSSILRHSSLSGVLSVRRIRTAFRSLFRAGIGIEGLSASAAGEGAEAMRRLAPHFEHRLFLTATLHIGYPEAGGSQRPRWCSHPRNGNCSTCRACWTTTRLCGYAAQLGWHTDGTATRLSGSARLAHRPRRQRSGSWRCCSRNGCSTRIGWSSEMVASTGAANRSSFEGMLPGITMA